MLSYQEAIAFGTSGIQNTLSEGHIGEEMFGTAEARRLPDSGRNTDTVLVARLPGTSLRLWLTHTSTAGRGSCQPQSRHRASLMGFSHLSGTPEPLPYPTFVILCIGWNCLEVPPSGRMAGCQAITYSFQKYPASQPPIFAPTASLFQNAFLGFEPQLNSQQ